MNSTRTLKSIIVALLIALGLSLYIDRPEIVSQEGLCVDYSQYAPSTLETGLIGDMVSIYRNDHLRAINTNKKLSDHTYEGVESITFDLDTIQKFIYHIKKGVEANSNNSTIEKLGLRIYYGAYPKKTVWGQTGYKDLEGFLGDPITEKYEDKHTLVFIPIRINKKGEVVDFNPLDSDTYESGITKYERPENFIGNSEIDPSPAAKINIMSLSGKNADRTISRNHGGLYPPLGSLNLAF